MNRVVYLPLDPDLAPSAARQLAEAVKGALQSSDAPARGRPASGWLSFFFFLGGEAQVYFKGRSMRTSGLWLVWL